MGYRRGGYEDLDHLRSACRRSTWPVQSERGPGTIPEQPLQPRAIVGGDADRAVEAESSGAAPPEHVVGLGTAQQRPTHVQSEDAALYEGRKEDNARRRPAMDSALYTLSLAGCDEDREGARRRASPLYAVGEMSPTPILLVHGADDDRVHPSVSLDFAERLLDEGHPHRLMLLEEAGHDLTSHSSELRIATVQWLSRYLPGLDPVPALRR